VKEIIAQEEEFVVILIQKKDVKVQIIFQGEGVLIYALGYPPVEEDLKFKNLI
jgi:hypothetical protein